jgi:DNA polymerase III sliding clamp (beta) subunit (PCNA family)
VPIKATFDRAALLEATGALQLGIDGVRVELLAGKAALSSVNPADGMRSKTSVPFKGNAAGCTFGVNAKYLAEMLTAYAPHERVTIAFKSREAAGGDSMTITSPEDAATLSLLMPMRV